MKTQKFATNDPLSTLKKNYPTVTFYLVPRCGSKKGPEVSGASVGVSSGRTAPCNSKDRAPQKPRDLTAWIIEKIDPSMVDDVASTTLPFFATWHLKNRPLEKEIPRDSYIKPSFLVSVLVTFGNGAICK